jgi:hypothetical protein
MKTYGFDESQVMRELERLEIAKNGIPESKIEKKASVEESDSLLCKLTSFSKSLRKIGKNKDADVLDFKIAKYAAENVHLYRAHDEDGEDLIEFAHSDGPVEIYESKGGYGIVETQLTQHKKIVDVVNKQPTGKYASSSFLGEIASILKVAGNDDIEQIKEDLDYGRKFLKQILSKFDIDIVGSTSFVGDHIGFFVDSKGIYFKTPKYGYKPVASVKNDSGYPEIEKNEFWPLFVSYNRDVEKAARNWEVSELKPKEYWEKETLKANNNIRESLKDVIKTANTIGVESIPDDPFKFISFVDNQDRMLRKLESSKWLIDQGIDTIWNDEDIIDRYNKGLEKLRSSIDKLKLIKEDKYIQLINSILKDISNEVHRIGISYDGFDNVNIVSVSDLKSKFGASDAKVFFERLERALPILRNARSIKSSSAKYNFTKNADALDDLLKAVERMPKNQDQVVQAPTTVPVSSVKTPAAPVPQNPAVFNKTRREYVNQWKSKVDKEYVGAVDNMQEFLVSTLYSNANAIFISILDKPGVAGLINNLKETAAKDYRGDFDIDAQWGPGTSKAVEAAKKLLSMLPNNSGVENIKSGIDININGKTGYLYYAGYDTDKQKEVAKIASENVKVMNDVLSKNNLGMFGFSQNKEKSVNSVLDFIPKDTNMWADSSFLSLGISDGNSMPEGIPTAQITKQDLSNLINFDRWMKANDIIGGGGMGSLFSDDRLNYPAFKVLIYRIKTRAEAMVRSASEATKAKAQEYFSDVASLFTRLGDAWESYKESNPDAKDNQAVSPRALELALLGGSAGIGSQTHPSRQSGSGASGKDSEVGEGFDSTINRRSKQEEIQIPVGYSIQPMYLQRQYPGTFDKADDLAPVIDIQTIKNIVSNPYSAYESIVGVTNVTWAQMLSDLRYPTNDNAVSSNGGVAIKDTKGNTIKYINLSETSATRVRISSEWKLKKLIDYLVSIQIGLRKVNTEYYRRVTKLVPGKEGLERATANNEAVVEWNQAIEYAITSIRREINNLRTGKVKGFQI